MTAVGRLLHATGLPSVAVGALLLLLALTGQRSLLPAAMVMTGTGLVVCGVGLLLTGTARVRGRTTANRVASPAALRPQHPSPPSRPCLPAPSWTICRSCADDIWPGEHVYPGDLCVICAVHTGRP